MKGLVFIAFTILLCTPLAAEKIVFSANGLTGQAGNSNTTTSLSGNAYVKTETMEIHADNLELSGEDYRFIKAEGHINGKNLETNMTFTCEQLSYDRITKIAELKGNVNFTDEENDVQAQAQIIIYNQIEETSVMQIKINLTQKDNVCSGAYAVYYKKEQLLELSGNAQIKQKDDLFRAQHIKLNMDTQEITLDGNVKGSVTDSKPAKKKTENSESTEPAEESENSEKAESSEKSEGADSSQGEENKKAQEEASGKTSVNTKEKKNGE